MSLYVRLNAEYASDTEFIEAGPMAELLYIRALCFCKRKLIDGTVSSKQLVAIALGIPNPKRHARALVEVGLWVESDDGWLIADWLKWNKSADEIETERLLAKEAGERGNHERWHVGPEGKPSSKCRLCHADRFGSASGNPIGDPTGGAKRGRSPKPEPEPEEEPKPEPEEEPSTGTSSFSSHPVADHLDDDDIDRIVKCIVDHRIQQNPARGNPTSYRQTVERSVRTERLERIHELAVMCSPDTPISLLAGAAESGDTRQLASWLRTPDKPEPDPGPPLTREQREALIAANKEQA